MKSFLKLAAAVTSFAACALTLRAGSVALNSTWTLYSSANNNGGVWAWQWNQLTSPSGKKYSEPSHQPPKTVAGYTSFSQTLNEVGTWTIDQWSQSGAQTPVEMSTYPQTVTVTSPTATITTAVAPLASYGSATGGGTYNNGSNCTVTATPATHCYFVSFTWDAPAGSGTIASTAGSGSTSAVSHTFSVSGSRTIYANFQQAATYLLTLSTNGTGSGTLTASPNQPRYYANDTVTVTASSAANSHLTSISNGGAWQQTFSMPSNDVSLTATFDRNVASVSVNSATYTYDGSAKAVTANVSPAVSYSMVYNGSGTAPSAAGTYTAAANVTDPNWTGSGTGTLTINPAPTSFSVNGPFTYTGSPITATVSASPAAASFTTGGTLTATAAGTYTASAAANGNYTGANNALTWTISKANQAAVTLTPSSTSVSAGQSVTFTAAGGNGTGAYGWSGAASGAGATTTVTFPNAGTYTVSVSRAGDGNYYASNTASATISVGAIPTTFSASGSFTYDGSPKTVTITPNPAGATYTTSGAVTATAAGTYSVTVTAVGNFAGSSTLTWTIAKATPVVNWNAPAAITYGTPLSGVQLNATANTSGSFAYSPTAGVILNAGTHQTLTAVFNPTDSANYLSASGSTAIDVLPASQAVTVTPTSASITAGGSVAFTGAGGRNGYTWGGAASGSGTTTTSQFSLPGAYQVSVFSPAGNGYQQSNTAIASVSVNPALQTVSITPAAVTVLPGQQVSLAASGGMNGYVWGGSVTGSGVTALMKFGTPGDYGATVFSPAGGAFAQSNTASATVSVRASQTIMFPAPGSFFLRTGGATLSASASSGLPVRFTVVSGPGTLAGGRLAFSAVGAITVQADQDGNAYYAAAAPVRQTVFVTDPPATTLDFAGRTRLTIEGHQDSNAALPEKH